MRTLRFWNSASARLLAFACVAALAFLAWAPPASAQGDDHCKSGKHVLHDGAIHGVSIEDVVDRDGDGYASRFTLRLRADSRQSQPRQQGKGLMKAFHKVFTGKIGLPLPFTANKRCLDLVPGYVIQVQTEEKEWIDWGYRHMNAYDEYPGPGKADDERDLYVDGFEKDASGYEVASAGGHLILRRPDDNEPRTGFENDGRLTDGDRAVLTGLYVRTCWKPMGRMKAADEDIPRFLGCVDLNGDYEGFREIFQHALLKNMPRGSANSYVVDLTDRFEGGFKVEVPELDREAELTAEEQTITQTPEVTRTLGGQVLSQERRNAISRAVIDFRQVDGDATRTAISSTEGRYAIEVPVGTYEVDVDQALYRAAATRVVVSEESNATANFFLTPDEEATEAALQFAEQVDRRRGGLDTGELMRRLPERRATLDSLAVTGEDASEDSGGAAEPSDSAEAADPEDLSAQTPEGVTLTLMPRGGLFLAGVSSFEDISREAGASLGGQQSVFTYGGSVAFGARDGPVNLRLTGLRTSGSLVSTTEGVETAPDSARAVRNRILALTGDVVVRPIPRFLIQPYAVGGVGARRLSVQQRGEGAGTRWDVAAQVGLGIDVRLGSRGVTLGVEVVDYLTGFTGSGGGSGDGSSDGGMQHDAFAFLTVGVPIF